MQRRRGASRAQLRSHVVRGLSGGLSGIFPALLPDGAVRRGGRVRRRRSGALRRTRRGRRSIRRLLRSAPGTTSSTTRTSRRFGSTSRCCGSARTGIRRRSTRSGCSPRSLALERRLPRGFQRPHGATGPRAAAVHLHRADSILPRAPPRRREAPWPEGDLRWNLGRHQRSSRQTSSATGSSTARTSRAAGESRSRSASAGRCADSRLSRGFGRTPTPGPGNPARFAASASAGRGPAVEVPDDAFRLPHGDVSTSRPASSSRVRSPLGVKRQ